MRIVAIKDMSAGNESVGEMWQETKIFSQDTTLFEVMKWANSQAKRIVLTVPENDTDEFFANILNR